MSLLHRGCEAADQVEVRSGCEPLAANQRCGGERRAAHDVGGTHAGGQVFDGLCIPTRVSPFGCQCSRALGPVVPDAYLADRARARMRGRQQARDTSGAEYQQRGCILAREIRRTQRRRRGRSMGGDLVAIELRQRHARVGVVKHIGRVQPRQAACAIAGKDIDGLDAQVACVAPRGHDQHGASITAGLDGMHMARRHRRFAAKASRSAGTRRSKFRCARVWSASRVFMRGQCSLPAAASRFVLNLPIITDPHFYAVAVPAVLMLGVSKSGFGAGFGSLAVPLMALAVPCRRRRRS